MTPRRGTGYRSAAGKPQGQAADYPDRCPEQHPAEANRQEMVARPGFLGGLRQSDAPERDAGSGFASSAGVEETPVLRLGDPNAPRPVGGHGNQPGFDPVWGTLGAPSPDSLNGWLERAPDGVPISVEIFGNGFQISGQVRTGQFDRLSDWINMQNGFIQVRDALQVHLGLPDAPDPDQRRGTLWVRLDQVAIVGERTPVQQSRPGALVVQKQRRRVSIVTPGYNLQGSIHVHAHGSMAQFLELPEPHFLPVTDLTVRWLSSSTLLARFPFALVNRMQLVTILERPASAAADKAGPEGGGTADGTSRQQWGAA
jgi:hypothetical protein